MLLTGVSIPFVQTMASSVTIEVDHKRGSVWVRGRPEAVEEGRKDFQNKLASLFPGDFLAVRNTMSTNVERN